MRGTAALFAGPSLRPADLAALPPGIVALPPARLGDIARAVAAGAAAIGLVDGRFETVPAPWHKEILAALAAGVPVLGAASMGALRAAELGAYGMRGIGAIAAAFASGELEADDEVAVQHGPAEAGHVPTSEALVDIRATLGAAVAAGVVGAATAAGLLEAARATFFKERRWERLLEGATDVDAAAALRAWLPEGRVSLKRRDALLLVEALAETLAGRGAPVPTPPSVPATIFWRDADAAVALDEAAARGVDELRLDPDLYEAARRDAMLRRALRRAGGEGAGRRIGRDRLRRRLGLGDGAAWRAWATLHGLGEEDVARLVLDEARADAAPTPDDALLRDALATLPGAEALVERARAKAARLAELGREGGSSAFGAGTTPGRVVAWYFEEVLGREVPDDLAAYARHLGLPDSQALTRLLLEEWLYYAPRAGEARGGDDA